MLDPALWVHRVLGPDPHHGSRTFLRAPRGASILALTARQCGKTTTAAWGMAHAALVRSRFAQRGRLPGAAASAERFAACATPSCRGRQAQSRQCLRHRATNGSRVLALPGSDDSFRGLTVDAWIVADEAARLSKS